MLNVKVRVLRMKVMLKEYNLREKFTINPDLQNKLKIKMLRFKVSLKENSFYQKLIKTDIVSEKRHNFIIIPNGGIGAANKTSGHSNQDSVEFHIIAAPETFGYSHVKLLQILHLCKSDIENIMVNYPRGHFVDNKIFLYQGDLSENKNGNMLSPENIEVVKKHLPNLKKMMTTKEDVRVYMGVIAGRLGNVLEPLKRLRTKESMSR